MWSGQDSGRAERGEANLCSMEVGWILVTQLEPRWEHRTPPAPWGHPSRLKGLLTWQLGAPKSIKGEAAKLRLPSKLRLGLAEHHFC